MTRYQNRLLLYGFIGEIEKYCLVVILMRVKKGKNVHGLRDGTPIMIASVGIINGGDQQLDEKTLIPLRRP